MKYEYDGKKVSDDLKNRRQAFGLNLEKAAAQIGIGTATLLRIELEQAPTIETLENICTWLDTPPGTYFKVIK